MSEMSIEGRTREDILKAALNAGKAGAHIAPSLSIVEIALSILGQFDSNKDTFVLSKGHGALGYYAAMHQSGFISDHQFATFESDGGEFPGQPSRSPNNHVDYSSGSLGMGLPYGVGTAIAEPNGTTYVILGDGEVGEGSIWEAAALASKLKCGNLVAIIDQNNLQSDGKCNDVLGMNLFKIWQAYGWNVYECNGHSVEEITKQIQNRAMDAPTVILAHTIKGKGVSFMENDNTWHHHELKIEQYEQAILEIGARYGLG